MFIVALYITEIGNNLDISYKRTDKNMVHIHNGVLFNCLKKDIMEISGIWKQLQNIFSKWGNPDPQEKKWYVYTYNWILGIK